MEKLSIMFIGALLFLSPSQSYSAWVKIGTGPQNGQSRINALSYGTDGTGLKRVVYAGTNGGVYYSLDTGITWLFSAGSPKNILSLCDNIKAGTNDSGAYNLFLGNWLSSGFGQNGPINGLAMPDGSFLLGTNNGVFCGDVNAGHGYSIGLSNRKINSISAVLYYLNQNNNSSSYFLFAGSDTGMFFASYGFTSPPASIPPQATWTSRNNGLTSLHITAITTGYSANNVLTGTLDNGVFISRDTGESWISFSEGLTDKNVSALTYGDVFIPFVFGATFANNVAAIWRRPLSDMTSTLTEKGNRFANTNFDIMINKRLLKYVVPNVSDVKIRIFNLNGKLMYSAQIRGQIPGSHSMPLASDRVSSGNYILDFRAGPYMVRKAIAVMR